MNQLKGMIKDLFTKNLGLKLLSVILALLLWLTVMNLSDPTITKTIEDVPVQVINEEVITSRGYSYAIESGEKVDVRVRGRRTIVDSLTADDFNATADFNSLSRMYMATIDVTCRHENSDELELTLRTETMAVKLEDEVTEPRNIHIIQNGEVKENYYLYSVNSDTALVSVTGSVSQVAKVHEVVAEIDVDGVISSFAPEVVLYAIDDQGEKIDPKKIILSQDTITVDVTICPTKEIPVRVIAGGNPAEHYYVEKIDQGLSQVLVAADEEALMGMDEKIIRCDVDGKTESFDDQIDLQKEFGDRYIIADDRKTMGYNVSIKEMIKSEMSVNAENIELRGTDPDKYDYRFGMNWKLGLTVWGREEDLTNLEVSDFSLYVDVSDCEQGNYSLDIKSDYSGDLELELDTVNVTVTEKKALTPGTSDSINTQENRNTSVNGGIGG